MKLLFDVNLSRVLVRRLSDLFPGSAHAESIGLDRAGDTAVWLYAKSKDFVVVTQDQDFPLLALAKGAPPYIVWISMGNCSTREVEAAIRKHADRIRLLPQEPECTALQITRGPIAQR